jgi:hypothetical protein
MNVDLVLKEALNLAMSISSGSITYNNKTVVGYKSFLRHQTRDMKEVGFEQMYDDLHMLVKPEDIEEWDLVPSHTQVTVDGVDYIVGRTVTTTPGYVTIFLRLKK